MSFNYNPDLDTLIKYRSDHVQLTQVLLSQSREEPNKFQEILDYCLERALFHGNLTVANAITKPSIQQLADMEMSASLPSDVNKVLHCFHIALDSKNTEFINLISKNYAIEELYSASLTYPDLTLAKYTFEHYDISSQLTVEEATPLARLAARCGDIVFLNKLLKRCAKSDVKNIYEKTIEINFIPARNSEKPWLTRDRCNEYRKNQGTYVTLFLNAAAMLASHMQDNNFSYDFDEELKPNLRFLGRCRQSMAHAVHPNIDSVKYGIPRDQPFYTPSSPEYQEYFNGCQDYLAVEELTINGRKVELPLTSYSTQNWSKTIRSVVWIHPPPEVLPEYLDLTDSLYKSLDLSDPLSYLYSVLSLYYYSTQGLLYTLGSAACNDICLHALLYKAEMLLPYEGILRNDCLVFTKTKLNDFLNAWPSVLGLENLEQCAEFLTKQYQKHISSHSIELTSLGVIRLKSNKITTLLEPKNKTPKQSPLLKHLAAKYLPNEKAPFTKKVLERLFRVIAVKGIPQECRFMLAVVDLNARNKKGNTALHLAVMNGRIENVKALLIYGNIDKAARNDKGLTPWGYIAKHKDNKDLQDALYAIYPKPIGRPFRCHTF